MDLATQPCPGYRPLPLHRRRRDAHDLGRLLDGQSREIAKFDKPALFRIQLRQLGECSVQRDQVHFFVLGTSVYRLVQRYRDLGTATLGRLTYACIIYKNLAHDVCRSAKAECEVPTINAVL